MTMDNPETMDVANGSGRLTILKSELESYLARGYRVPGGNKKAAQPIKKKVFSKKSEPKDDNED